jgi:MFS transporter, DHA2 family, multidrug resistance protein
MGAAASAVPSPAPLVGGARAVTLIALAMATFMQVLDTTIANVSIPTISGYLGVSSDQGTWIITSFAVANGISVPLTGWLMRRFGVVRTFALSVLLFTIASFLCGISGNMTELVLFRVLQGAVSGPMIPGSQALLLTLFPESKKGTALAIWSATTLVAPICGPILGGYISDNYAWGWIFFINVPVGLICSVVCWHFLKSRETATKAMKLDRVGLFLLVVWVGSLQVMLDQGKDLDWFNSNTIVTLCIVCIVSLAAWIIWELGDPHPIVDLSLFKSRSFTFGTLALCLVYGVFFGNVVLMPLWLQSNVSYTATWAGIVTAPSGITALLVAPLVGKYISRFDPRAFASGSFVVFAVSYFMRAAYPPDASFWVFALPALVQGIAMGVFFVALLTIALDRIPPEKIPAASGLNNFLRIVASGFATSLTTTYWDRREAFHQSRLVESLSVFDPALREVTSSLEALGFSDQASAANVLHEVVDQAYLLSSLDLFYFFGWTTLLLIVACWVVRRPVAKAGVVGGE